MGSRHRWTLALALVLVAGCAAPGDEAEDVASGEADFTDSQSATTEEWGRDLWRSFPMGRPAAGWPGVFDQPNMSSGPGACGFAAIANLSAQLVSAPGAEQTPVTQWNMLEQQRYSTLWGIAPWDADRLLERTFADASLVGDAMKNTHFTWRHEGKRAGPDAAFHRLEDSLDRGIPFIALVAYGHDEAAQKKGLNHFVVVVAHTADTVTIAHWGRYEPVERDVFLAWWKAHTFWSYAGIYPDRPSSLAVKR
jgi:hypothetical protein